MSWSEGIRIRSDSVLGTRYLAWHATKTKRLGIRYSATISNQTYPLPPTNRPEYPDDSISINSILISFGSVKQRAFGQFKQQGHHRDYHKAAAARSLAVSRSFIAFQFFRRFGGFLLKVLVIDRRRCRSQKGIYTAAACSLREAAINLLNLATSYLSN